MTPVSNPIPEPDKFDERCRKPGDVWLKANPVAERPRDLWSPFRHALADGFDDRCGYAAMYIPSGTVDHVSVTTRIDSLLTSGRTIDILTDGLTALKASKWLLDC